MSKLVIKNLTASKELDREALAAFKGGTNPLRLLTQIASQNAEMASAVSSYTLDQEPELGVSAGVLQNQPFTPHTPQS